MQKIFQQSSIDPALKALQQQIIPQIQQSFIDQNAGASSALNQALAEAAGDVTTNLGSQFMNFFQQQQANKLGALGQIGGLAATPTQEPMISNQVGLLPALLGAIGNIGGAGIGAGWFGGSGGTLGSGSGKPGMKNLGAT